MTDKSNWKNKNRDIIKGAIEGVKKIAAPFIKEAVGLEEAKKVLTGLKPELKGLTGFKKISKSKKPSPHTGGRTRKFGGGILKKIGKILSKKKPTPKPAPKEPKIGSKEWFDKAGPFERNRVVAARESAKRGDVYNKAGTVVGTPGPHRSAETIMKRHPGSYQLKKGKK